MMASFFQMNIAFTLGSGPLPSNTIANPKGELKAITTRSGIVIDGPSVPMPPPFINLKQDERVEETLMDQDLAEYTIKVPPPVVQKSKPPSQRNFVVHQRDPLHPNIPYPSRMHKQKQQEKDEKLPKKLRDPGKFLIPCGFSELKCKALADLVPLLLLQTICLRSSSMNLLLPHFHREIDDLSVDIESDLKEIEYLLNHDPIKEMDSILEDLVDEDNLADLNDNLVDTMPEMFTNEHALDYSSPPLYDEYDDDLFEDEFDTEYVYDDPFDSNGEKIKESKLLIDELDLPRSSDLLPSP
nr:hypothetical protein [Tanacetum cinerariifolium]